MVSVSSESDPTTSSASTCPESARKDTVFAAFSSTISVPSQQSVHSPEMEIDSAWAGRIIFGMGSAGERVTNPTTRKDERRDDVLMVGRRCWGMKGLILSFIVRMA